MSVLRLNATSDLKDDYGRAQLQETLELISNALRKQQAELEQVKEADEIVRAVPIEAYPIAQGPVQTSAIGGGAVGDLLWSGADDVPAGYLRCDGTSYSKLTTYADLFAVLGYSHGGSGDNFNVPDAKGRSLMGSGTGAGLTARTLGDTPGQENVKAHTHPGGAHVHDQNHYHVHDHTHNEDYVSAVGAGHGPDPAWGPATYNNTTAHASDSPNNSNTGTPIKDGTADPMPNTGSASATTGSTGAGSDNLHPALVLGAFIRYTTGASGSEQIQSIAWGEVQATWNLSNGTYFPVPVVENTSDSLADSAVQEPNVTATCEDTNEPAAVIPVANKIRAVVRLPFNFREWRARAIRIRTKVSAGAWPSAWTIYLRVMDPSTGSVLASTSRTVSGNDSDFEDLAFSTQNMGPNWKAGYPLVFELDFAHRTNVTDLSIKVGRLEIGWR